MMEKIKTETAEVARLACAATHIKFPTMPQAGEEGAPFVILPDGHGVGNLEALLPRPVRAKGSVCLDDAASFIRYINERKTDATDDTTRIYCRVAPPAFVAVFNDNGWRDHRAVYSCPLSREWTRWTQLDGKPRTQEEFARFIEDNALDIAEPAAADMIEIARSLEAKKKVNFASGIRLDNGQTQFTYEEDIQGTAAKGRLVVPETFTIGVAVLEGGPRYAVCARLRYRIGDKGALSLWYDLLRPQKIVDDAIAQVRGEIEDKAKLAVFMGAP